MTRAIAAITIARAHNGFPQEILRSAIVTFSAVALIAAGQALPF